MKNLKQLSVALIALTMFSCHSVVFPEGMRVQEVIYKGNMAEYILRGRFLQPYIILQDSIGKFNVVDTVYINKIHKQ